MIRLALVRTVIMRLDAMLYRVGIHCVNGLIETIFKRF